MFPVKSNLLPRILKFTNKIYNHGIYFHLQNQSLVPLAYLYTLRKFERIPPQTNNFTNYSTSEINIPPPPKKSNVFGALGGLKYESVDLDPEELKEEERLKNVRAKVSRKHKPSLGECAAIIKNYIGKGDLKHAEGVLTLCKRNKDIPTPYMYTLLIRAFAVQGDLLKCYKYYSEMKSRQYKICENVFTSLFNACANSPDSVKALNYLDRIQEYMAKIDCPMNHAHYNVLVKALGRHHKYDEAMRLVQTMLDNKIKIGISTLNSLMYAANSNTESGLKDVIYIWQLMRKMKVPPDVFSYNLLLRAIRDTHFGGCTMQELLLGDKDNAIATDKNRPDLLEYPPQVSPLPFENIHKTPKTGLTGTLETKSSDSDLIKTPGIDNEELSKSNSEILPESIANLDLDAVLEKNKLILFGGVDGLLEKMKNDRIEANIKTITFLMELTPGSTAAENEVIKHAKLNKIPLDIDFYNMLIKKRALRGSKKDAKAVLDDIHLNDLRPNIVTFGVLALICTTGNESRELLQALKATNLPLNKYIADSLLSNAFFKRDFGFILELMERMLFQRVRLDEESYEKLDKFKKDMSDLVKRKDKRAKTESFKVGFSKFCMRYKKWQEEMGRRTVTESESKKK